MRLCAPRRNDVLLDLFFREVQPAYICSDNGSEFRAKELVEWLDDLCVKTDLHCA